MRNKNRAICRVIRYSVARAVATCRVICYTVARAVAACRVIRYSVARAVAACRVICYTVARSVAACRVVRYTVASSVAICRVICNTVANSVAACTISAPPVSMRKLGTSFFKNKLEGGNFSEKLFYPQQIACICRNLRQIGPFVLPRPHGKCSFFHRGRISDIRINHQIGSRIENDFCTIVFNNGIAFLIGLI